MFRSSIYTRQIQALDPVQDHAKIVYMLAGYEFPWDSIRALEVALMRTYCSPQISGLLHRTGQFEKYGQKRYDDTALLMAEIMQSGYDSLRGQQAIARMNHVHSHFAIDNEDYLYVLSTFIFEPIRWIDQFGWRKTTPKEREAVFHFFRQVGLRMHLQDIPDQLEDFQQFALQYETTHFRFHQSNRAIGDATVRIVAHWLPRPLRFAVFPVINTLLDDSMRNAFGYPAPSRWLIWMVHSTLKIRTFFLKLFNFNRNHKFFTEKPNRTYPQGYEIEALGPSCMKKIR